MEKDFFDRFQLPDESDEKPITFDWQGGEIYEGDICYSIDGELILKDDLAEYIEKTYGKAVSV